MVKSEGDLIHQMSNWYFLWLFSFIHNDTWHYKMNQASHQDIEYQGNQWVHVGVSVTLHFHIYGCI